MYDTQTESLWLQRDGHAIEGSEVEGEGLQELADKDWKEVRWGDWRRAHPDTQVLTCPHCEGRGEATGTIDEIHEAKRADEDP